MKEKLPKVYVNKIEKEIKNNEKVYSTKQTTELIETKKSKESIPVSITQKINKILNTKNHIYKIPVKIKIKDTEEEIITKIIGKNKTNIITIDNELIAIKKIEDIEICEK